jgi:hypothetical protein
LDCCCFQGWESVQRWWWWWWWWWWELHDTWYTTLALFGVQNRGVSTYYICIYILPIYYLVYIYVQVYIHIFITKCYYTRHNTHTSIYK